MPVGALESRSSGGPVKAPPPQVTWAWSMGQPMKGRRETTPLSEQLAELICCVVDEPVVAGGWSKAARARGERAARPRTRRAVGVCLSRAQHSAETTLARSRRRSTSNKRGKRDKARGTALAA